MRLSWRRSKSIQHNDDKDRDAFATTAEKVGPREASTTSRVAAPDEEKNIPIAGVDDDGSDDPSKEELDYPEGGREAWIVTFGAWCAMGTFRASFDPFPQLNTIYTTPHGTFKARLISHSSRRSRPRQHHLTHPNLPVLAPAQGLQRRQHQLDLQHLRLPRFLLRTADRAYL